MTSRKRKSRPATSPRTSALAIEHALVDVESAKVMMLKEQIARFLHAHKDDKKGRS
jgi:hypothetical protein